LLHCRVPAIEATVARGATTRTDLQDALEVSFHDSAPLDSCRHADIVFVVKDSELVEQGTHEELLAAGGLYAELYKIQTSESAGKVTEQSAAS